MSDVRPLTHIQKLRNNQPLWATARSGSVITRKSAGSRAYDVIIVGAGISGALMAQALCGRGLDILIIDRRDPVRGSSLASTAMIQHEIDVPLYKLTAILGKNKARRVWQRSADAVLKLADLVADLGLKCDFERKRTLFLAGDAYGARALRTEVEARHAAGIECQLIDAATLRETRGIDRTAAIESAISASANPAQLTAGILRNARIAGVEIVGGVEITDVRSITDDVVLATRDGQLITAKHVVFCTGYEFLHSVAARSHMQVSTWALASRPDLKRPDWLNSYLVWEGADPYLYFRTTPTGRVVVGGEDESSEDAFADDGKLPAKARILIEKLGDLTGISIGKPDFIWSAAFGVTPDGLPMIGAVPGLKNVYSMMGYGGNGITFSQIGAELVSSEILGHPDQDADLFPFH